MDSVAAKINRSQRMWYEHFELNCNTATKIQELMVRWSEIEVTVNATTSIRYTLCFSIAIAPQYASYSPQLPPRSPHVMTTPTLLLEVTFHLSPGYLLNLASMRASDERYLTGRCGGPGAEHCDSEH